MAKYLVTGGAGFIGSHLVDRLVDEGKEVIVLDNFLTGKRGNLTHLTERIKLIEGDIRDLQFVQTALAGVDYLLHQAALPSVPRSLKDPQTTNDININGTLNVLIAAAKAKVKKVVIASSSSVYGDTPTLPKQEEMSPNPKSPYAASKLAGEYYAKTFWNNFQLPVVILRYFNVFGPRQDPDSPYAAVIPKFITALKAGQPPLVFGDGEQTRDFTYVANVVAANLCALQAENAGGKVFNVSGGQQVSINEVLTKLKHLMGVKIETTFAPPRPGDILHSFADINKAKKYLGYQPTVAFEDGLKRTLAYYLA